MHWSPRFLGLDSWGWSLSVVLSVSCAVALFIVLRRYEARLVPSHISRILLTLRCLILGLLLFVMLQPTLQRSWQNDVSRRIVIGVDVSESMSTADSHASKSEMLLWGKALGMLNEQFSATLVDEWLSALESGQPVDWGDDAADSGQQIRRQYIDRMFKELQSMPRKELVRRLLQAQPNQLLQNLSESMDIDLQAFGGRQRTVLPEELAAFLTTDLSEIVPDQTDAIGMMAQSIAENADSKIDGFVLLSDGRQTPTADAANQLAQIQSLGIPVYCVPIGSNQIPRDLSIANLNAPESVFQQDNAVIDATVITNGYEGEDITVELCQEDQILQSRQVTVTGASIDIQFDLPTEIVGTFDYQIRAQIRDDELRTDNNSQDFTISVDDHRVAVWLVEGPARWEFRYLKGALERDSRVNLDVTLMEQPFLDLLNHTFLPREVPSGGSLQAKLTQTDVLMIGDIAVDQIPADFWVAVRQAVETDGLTLVLIPGKQDFPFGHTSGELAELLPVTSPKPLLAERLQPSQIGQTPSEFRFRPTPQGADRTMLNFPANDAARPVTFDTLPGHLWACTGQPKLGASVWATLHLDGDDAGPGIVHQYFGFGQVVWIGVDSTWKWRRRAGDRWHHRFWGELVRWAIGNKTTSGNDKIRMSLSSVLINDTDAVDVEVRWQNAAEKPNEELEIAVLKRNDDGDQDPVQTIALTGVPNTQDRATGKISKLDAGEYTIRLQTRNDRSFDPTIESTLIVQRQPSSELASISCHRDFLQQLATATGGQMLEVWQLEELHKQLNPESEIESKAESRPLWDTWPTLVVFFALLTTEWIIRKIHGLP